MAMEKTWDAVPPQAFTANGDNTGLIQLSNPALFKVKQQVKLFSDSVSVIDLEVKKVVPSGIYVGPKGEGLFKVSNLSPFTTSDNAKVSAQEQERPAIPPDAFNRAMYEEAPVVGQRTILVDKLGRKIDESNPLPTTATLDFSGDINISSDGFDSAEPDSVLATGSEDGTKTGVKHAVRVDSALDLRTGISDGANKAQVNGSRELSVIDSVTRSNIASLIALIASGISVDDNQTQAQLVNILNQLASGINVTDSGAATILNSILTKLGTTLKTDDDETQVLLNDLKTILNAGTLSSLSIGTENGQVAGTKHVFVNNIKEMILKAQDRDQVVTYADAGTKDQRVVTIDYTSPTIGSGAGYTARKTISYTLAGTRYVVSNIQWTLV